MMTRRGYWTLAAIAVVAFLGLVASVRGSADGFLRQKIGILIYSDFANVQFPDSAQWILRREIRSFESFLWSNSDRKVYIDPVIVNPGRLLLEQEFLNAGPRWGYLPGYSSQIESDLQAAGWNRSDFDILVLLYEPLPDRDTPLAGATYLPPELSSIPLRRETFLQSGRRHPLHLLLVHEYLHQMNFLFSDAGGDTYLIDPDTDAWERCSSGTGDELQVALRRNATCNEVEWFLLSPESGIWVAR
jgi:hypothetical protein